MAATHAASIIGRMSKAAIPRITFDTNVCNVINDPNKWPQLVAPIDAQKIRDAISAGSIAGFVSEATLFVECLSFPDKLTYLSVAGTPGPRPIPDPRMVAIFDDLGSIGAELLHAPLIGAEKFSKAIPWAADLVHSIADRQTRFFDFIRPYPRHDPLKTYAAQLATSALVGVSKPSLWTVEIKQEWDRNAAGQRALEKAIRPIIGEWCDVMIVGSHVGYGNDIFCTADEGKNAGSGSLLFHGNRTNLDSQGITIMTPRQLVQHLNL